MATVSHLWEKCAIQRKAELKDLLYGSSGNKDEEGNPQV